MPVTKEGLVEICENGRYKNLQSLKSYKVNKYTMNILVF